MHKSVLFSFFNFSTVEQSCYAFCVFLFVFWLIFFAGGRYLFVWLGRKDGRFLDTSIYRAFVTDWLLFAVVLAVCTILAASLGMMFMADQALLRYVCTGV
jgi:hypothetical protein